VADIRKEAASEGEDGRRGTSCPGPESDVLGRWVGATIFRIMKKAIDTVMIAAVAGELKTIARA